MVTSKGEAAGGRRRRPAERRARSAAKGGPGRPGRGLDPAKPEALEPGAVLRHAAPLRLIDAVSDARRGRWLTAVWKPVRGWPIFRGHFPGEPVVPGVLLVEAIAQASGLLAYVTEPFDPARARMYLMTVERARFRFRVGPGDRLEIRTDLVDRRGPLWRFDGSINCRGEVVADARVVAALLEDGGVKPSGGKGGG